MTSTATAQQAADELLLAVRPRQGYWSEHDYLWLTDRCTRLVEFADGRIEELPPPTDSHQTSARADVGETTCAAPATPPIVTERTGS